MKRLLALVSPSLIATVLATSALAQTTFTWTGLAHDNLFDTPGNWQGGVAPTGNPTDNLIFPEITSRSILQGVVIATARNVGSITFEGLQYTYFLSGEQALTLNGNVTTTGGFDSFGTFLVPVILSTGNHIYTTGGSTNIDHDGVVSGAGGITKNGSTSLFLNHANTYTGGTILNSGTLYVSGDNALGSGTVTINGGTLGTFDRADVDYINLPNSFLLGMNPTFGGSYFSHDQMLILGSDELATTVAPTPGVTNVNLHLVGALPLYIDGRMTDGAGPTTYTFENDPSGFGYILSGHNSYTGGTFVKDGASVFFNSAGSLPASGLISFEGNGTAYAGLNDDSVSATTFVSHFDHTTQAGTIGFDNYTTYAGDIDLSGFSSAEGLALGTQSGATLTGAITATPLGYAFRSSGTLFLEGTHALTGSNDVWSFSFPSKAPGVLVLNQGVPNTYSGNTTASGGAIVFDSPGSMPAGTDLQLYNGGYISFTETSGLTLDNLVGRVSDQAGATSVLGIDTHDAIHNIAFSSYTYSAVIDFGNLNSPVYLGTASNVTISGNIVTTAENNDGYFLTGYNGGTLEVDSHLTGNRQVHVGLPGASLEGSTVKLSNTNSYTGGTVLNSGTLDADPSALGTGGLTVNVTGGIDNENRARLVANGILSKNINLQAGTLDIEPNDPLQLTGVISGAGGLSSIEGGGFTIGGNNTYAGGNDFASERITVTATTNTALGTGFLSLGAGSRILFYYTPAPAIGSLLQGDIFDDNDGFVVSASLVLYGDGGGSTLTIKQTEDGYFGGAIVQDGVVGSLVKIGPASLTIDGFIGEDNAVTQRYTGGTTIIEGKLVAGSTGALGTGPITVNGGTLGVAQGAVLANPITLNGGSLTGNGTIGSPISIGTGVILSPGDSPGTMTFTSGLTFAAGGSLDFEIQFATGMAGTDYDTLVVSGGALDISSSPGNQFTLRVISLDGFGSAGNVADFDANSSYSWLLVDGNTGGGITNFDPTRFMIDTSSFTNVPNNDGFSILQGVNAGNPALFLNFTPVPEPSTYVLLGSGLGLIVLAAWRRRRR